MITWKGTRRLMLMPWFARELVWLYVCLYKVHDFKTPTACSVSCKWIHVHESRSEQKVNLMYFPQQSRLILSTIKFQVLSWSHGTVVLPLSHLRGRLTSMTVTKSDGPAKKAQVFIYKSIFSCTDQLIGTGIRGHWVMGVLILWIADAKSKRLELL